MRKSILLTLFMIFAGSTSFTSVAAQGLVYVPVNPCRIVDTRNAGGAITANTFSNFRVSGTAGELAVQGGETDCLDPKTGTGLKPLSISAYVVAVPPGPGSGSGVLTAYPSDQLPPAVGAGSTVNFAAQQVIGNTTNITLCDPAGSCPTDGEFAILARSTNQHVVIDVQGYFYQNVKQLVAVDANGIEIGPLFGGDITEMSVMTSEGYAVRLRAAIAAVAHSPSLSRTIYFTDNSCGASGGTSWMEYEDYLPMPGSVFAMEEGSFGSVSFPQSLFYMPKALIISSNLSVLSSETSKNASCSVSSSVLSKAAQIFPNDPSITGVANSAYPAPLTLVYQ